MATFVDYSLPPDPRTGVRLPKAAVRPQRSKQRITKASTEELIRIVNELQEEIFEIVTFVTQMPFGGIVTYLKSVTFASGVNQTLAHLVPVAAAPTTGVPGAPSNGRARAGDASQIRFFIGNPSAAARVKLVSVDTKNIVLVADANVTADVLLMVVP